MQTEQQKKTQATVTAGKPALRRYQDTIVGKRSISALAYYELCMWLGALPGAIGLMLRKLLWPRLFNSCGKGTVFGAQVVLRHPNRIDIGERVVISDGCILDARSEAVQVAIRIGKDTILSNNTMLSCKNGNIVIGERNGIGAQTIIHSVNQAAVSIGNDVIIGPRCYIAGGGNYNLDRLDIPIAQQGLRDDPGVCLEDDIWLGANVTVLSGVIMHSGSVAGASATVTRQIPAGAICIGTPAIVARYRDNVSRE